MNTTNPPSQRRAKGQTRPQKPQKRTLTKKPKKNSPVCPLNGLGHDMNSCKAILEQARAMKSNWSTARGSDAGRVRFQGAKFIQPKKNGTVRFLSNFRKPNQRIRRKPFPIPKIKNMLLNLEGLTYASSLDLNMGYYHIKLSPGSKQICTIVLPWGKYEYQKLPMGVCNIPNIFQEKISKLFDGFDMVRAYIDDVLVTTKNKFEDHLKALDRILQRLAEAGLKVNAEKYFFGRT